MTSRLVQNCATKTQATKTTSVQRGPTYVTISSFVKNCAPAAQATKTTSVLGGPMLCYDIKPRLKLRNKGTSEADDKRAGWANVVISSLVQTAQQRHKRRRRQACRAGQC